jgi:hypothetical protein
LTLLFHLVFLFAAQFLFCAALIRRLTAALIFRFPLPFLPPRAVIAPRILSNLFASFFCSCLNALRMFMRISSARHCIIHLQ